jgi:hypothetical protein
MVDIHVTVTPDLIRGLAAFSGRSEKNGTPDQVRGDGMGA